jgi:large subunit ribosomal protein L13
MNKKTYSAKKEDLKRNWYVVDAKDWILGRLATRIAMVLRGKHKPIFTQHVDTGDNVVVLNVEKMKFTGKKLEQKYDFRNSGYPGGAKFTRYDKLMDENPEKVLYLAVYGMLPKNKMRSKVIKKLHIYKGETHPHIAQDAKVFDIKTVK